MKKGIETFKDLLESEFRAATCGSDSEDACIRTPDGGVVFTLPTSWGDYEPACFDMKKEEVEKAFNLIFYVKDMYKLLDSLDNAEAKELVKKIQEEKNLTND